MASYQPHHSIWMLPVAAPRMWGCDGDQVAARARGLALRSRQKELVTRGAKGTQSTRQEAVCEGLRASRVARWPCAVWATSMCQKRTPYNSVHLPTSKKTTRRVRTVAAEATMRGVASLSFSCVLRAQHRVARVACVMPVACHVLCVSRVSCVSCVLTIYRDVQGGGMRTGVQAARRRVRVPMAPALAPVRGSLRGASGLSVGRLGGFL